MALSGFATTEGTARYRERFRGAATDENHFRLAQGLWLSSVGVGTYLGDADDETDRSYTDALMRAVELGSNVLDAAANYRHQRSERALGAALKGVATAGFARDGVVVCTKGGYIPFDGAPPAGQEARRRYVVETFVESGLAAPEEIVGSHCMSPRYLEHQVAQSLGNLGLEAIDVYYVHNPESQLQQVSREEFERRLRAAFGQLEREREAGRVRFYGAATWNGFRVGANERSHHSLERMCELAREAGGDEHGFRFVQLPFNLAMPEAYAAANQPLAGREVSLLEAAEALGVTVIASASLFQGKVARGLPAHVREALGSQPTDAQAAIHFVRSTPGIATALVGMSRRAHVEENLRVAHAVPVSAENYARLFAGKEE